MNKKTFSAMFALAALFAVFLGGIGLSAPTYTINNPANWPVWPQKSTSTVLLDPVTSISIGREALAWMFFEDRLSAGLSSTHFSDTFFKGSLITMVQVDPASADFSPATNVFASDNIFFTLPSGDLSSLDLSPTHFAQLAARSVLKVQDPNWATVTTNGNSQSVTNQMLDGTRIDSSWLDFLKANWTTGAFNLADSGHAAPLLVWKDNNWLIRFVGDYAETASTDLSAWNNKIALFQPTNQGMLYTFFLQKGTSPTLNLSSGVMPPQSFVTAPYQYLQRTYDGNKYSRFTSLGGPVTVFDTEKSNNQWRRLLVGTTGVGTSFMNKPSDAWKKLSESTISSFSQPNGLTLSSGRLTGVYAIDVTNPSAPRGLWSITKTFFRFFAILCG